MQNNRFDEYDFGSWVVSFGDGVEQANNLRRARKSHCAWPRWAIAADIRQAARKEEEEQEMLIRKWMKLEVEE
jgi:hypothetical protein